MSTTNALDELNSALRSDDRQRVIELEEAATDALDTARDREERYRRVAEAVQQNETESPNSESLLQAVGEATQERSRLAGEMMSYLDDEAEGDDVAGTVETVQSAQESVRSHYSGVREEAAEVDVGVILSLTGPRNVTVPKGQPLSESFELAQVGTGSTTVECSVRRTDSLTVEPVQVDSLNAGDHREIVMSGEPKTDTTAVLRVSADESADQQPINVAVLSKSDYVSRARDSIKGLRSVVEDEFEERKGHEDDSNGKSNSSNEKGSGKGLTAKLTAALSKLDDVEKHIEKGNRKPADTNLTATQQQLGAFINTIESGNNHSILEDTVSYLTTNASYTIDTLEDAANAAI